MAATPFFTSIFFGKPGVAVIDAVDEGRVLLRADAERRHRDRLAVRAGVGLGEARRVRGVARSGAVGEHAVGARERAELVVERMVLVEDHEYVFDLRTQQPDQLSPV